MKRVGVAVVVFALLIALSGLSLWHLHTVTQDMTETLSQIKEYINNNEIGQAQSLTDQVIHQWHVNEKVMTRYVHHHQLDEITGIIARLPSLAQYGDISEFAAEVEHTRVLIAHIWDSEIPSPKNIF
ncbi:DUF4363 family protein [Youxingia wuxianensis]|uniref:DUF4363 family protein n=1 Tax=Youxingia wuxianensis TaxID=2763678 RepID=A0A926EQU1_9FIRM|nr:DUF4363 family protein [Youxingia wuxianensis]MBC8584679.1 DUF4363 family protein [Youxingia wuxianensis]